MNKGRGLQQQCQYVIDFRAMLLVNIIGASASNKSRGIAWIDLSWPIENRIECNSSLDRAPIIEGAAGTIKICIGRLYRVSGSCLD